MSGISVSLESTGVSTILNKQMMRTVSTPSPGNQKKRIKANLFENDNPEELEMVRKKYQESTVGKILVRLDRKTHVFISKEKNTPEYLQKLRKKYKIKL